MAKELRPMDISHTPELLRIAEEVRDTGEPRVLRHDNEDLAILRPIAAKPTGPRRRVPTTAD